MKGVNVLIAIPSLSSWEADFGMSLLFMTNYLASHYQLDDGKTVNFGVSNRRSSILANSREELIKEALDTDMTHVLFLDSDQTFPRDTFHKLYAHHKKIVAANVAIKTIPSNPTARKEDGTEEGECVFTVKESTGLEKVWRIGTGVMLIDLNVFKRKGMEQPWFTQTWNEKLQTHNGEDWGFCKKLEDSGAGIYIDHDVSKKVGHVGGLTYTHMMVEE